MWRISIHAPAKGATVVSAGPILTVVDFNPRPREGSDLLQGWPFSRRTNFNPRPREGSDVKLLSKAMGCSISIHAPAKGATLQTVFSRTVVEFQSTPPRRERHTLGQLLFYLHQFQSTPPRRERLVVLCVSSTFLNISIHAPAKGATVLR